MIEQYTFIIKYLYNSFGSSAISHTHVNYIQHNHDLDKHGHAAESSALEGTYPGRPDYVAPVLEAGMNL